MTKTSPLNAQTKKNSAGKKNNYREKWRRPSGGDWRMRNGKGKRRGGIENADKKEEVSSIMVLKVLPQDKQIP